MCEYVLFLNRQKILKTGVLRSQLRFPIATWKRAEGHKKKTESGSFSHIVENRNHNQEHPS
jgi:hypothetical protein